MMKQRKKFPIGIEDFRKIRTDDFYYVDKTGLIRDLLYDWSEVNLFTRPRRFGKSLSMSMLQYFFDPETDKSIFRDLAIAKESELCRQYMGSCPVISISLKNIHASTYEMAYKTTAMTLAEEAGRLRFLSDSSRLTPEEKQEYQNLNNSEMDEAVLCGSLRTLSKLLYRHYDRPVILLIDEYDVPLAKAFEQGYYDQMVLLIRNLLGQALKTNPYLKFAVLTGCMRISKESIFTGLNNLRVLSVSDVEFDEYFGFTDQEVRELLEYYDLERHYEKIRSWYNGYQFGAASVYCPWDVICYCQKLSTTPDYQPQNYWIHTSSNDVVRKFIEHADISTLQEEIEALVAGETVIKTIRPELTYRDMYSSVDNIWSVLYTTGYLTSRGCATGNTLALTIPNMEIRSIFTSQILELFHENAEKDGEALQAFCRALQEGNAAEVERQFEEYLNQTISIRDTFVQIHLKENFYHGILLGLLGFKKTWVVRSNRESGDGYSDILIKLKREHMGILIEVKYSQTGNLDKECRTALEQINTVRYAEQFREDEIQTVLKYGIACYKKRCRVMVKKEQI